MCRHLAYLGPPVTLASLALDPPHSLYRQSWAPTDMRAGGTVNADGFGLGWYPPELPAESPKAHVGNAGRAEASAERVSDAHSADAAAGRAGDARGAGSSAGEAHAGSAPTSSSSTPAPSGPAGAGGRGGPVRYRRSVPIWADENLPGLAGSIRSGAVLAAVRNGTTGMPLGEGAAAPFVHGRWLFSHNGLVRGWPGSMAKLAEGLPVTDLLTLDAPVDSALLWALILNRLTDGVAAAEAVASVVREVEAAAPGSRLNILLTDGEQLVATTWTHALWVKQTDNSVAVSSEPWSTDDPTWTELPDRTLLTATRYSCSTTPMEGRQ